jgi:hypothetical protein
VYYTYIENGWGGGGGTEFTRRSLFTNIQLNNKVVGRTELRQTQRMFSLLCVPLKAMFYRL